MWVGTGNGVVLSIPLVAAQPESSRSVVTTPTDNGGPGGVVRVYTDTVEKGAEKPGVSPGVSSFMPYCSMVRAFAVNQSQIYLLILLRSLCCYAWWGKIGVGVKIRSSRI